MGALFVIFEWWEGIGPVARNDVKAAQALITTYTNIDSPSQEDATFLYMTTAFNFLLLWVNSTNSVHSLSFAEAFDLFSITELNISPSMASTKWLRIVNTADPKSILEVTAFAVKRNLQMETMKERNKLHTYMKSFQKQTNKNKTSLVKRFVASFYSSMVVLYPFFFFFFPTSITLKA